MKVGGIDLVSIIVAVIATIAIILAELNSIKTKKKYGFALNPVWQIVVKNVILIFIIWFFLYKLSCWNGLPFVLLLMAILVSIYAFVTTNMIVMLVMLFLTGLQFGAVTLMPMIMVADCVDNYEYETGKRVEGPAFSILTLTIKVCLAIGAALGLILIQASGYDAGASMDKITYKTELIVYFAYVGMPGIFSLLATIPMFKYDIVGEKKAKIAAELQKRREIKE